MTIRLALLSLTCLALAAGCKKDKKAEDKAPAPASDKPATDTPPAADTPPATDTPPAGAAPATAAAELKAASGSKVSGKVTFTEKDGKVEIVAELKDLAPGEHAWHVHEVGDCSAPDAKSAGDHFNPSKHPHGAPDAPQHHEGDLGNLTAEADGSARKTLTVDFLTVAPGDKSVVGRALIVHEKADDMKTQPSGNAGARVACGVVEKQ